jgi:hypothetical protein
MCYGYWVRSRLTLPRPARPPPHPCRRSWADNSRPSGSTNRLAGPAFLVPMPRPRTPFSNDFFAQRTIQCDGKKETVGPVPLIAPEKERDNSLYQLGELPKLEGKHFHRLIFSFYLDGAASVFPDCLWKVLKGVAAEHHVLMELLGGFFQAEGDIH